MTSAADTSRDLEPRPRYPILRVPGIVLVDLIAFAWFEVVPPLVLAPTIIGLFAWFYGSGEEVTWRVAYRQAMTAWWSSVDAPGAGGRVTPAQCRRLTHDLLPAAHANEEEQ